MKPSGIVTLLTDFGLEDAYVGAMKGAILSVYARAAVVDVTHGVRPFAVLQGAFLLDSAWRSFPPGTVHVAVVDPGVGSERSAIAFKAADHIFIGPDNGLFTFLNDPISETVELATPPEAAPTFHGRDVFAPVAARLAAGAALAEVGRPRRAQGGGRRGWRRAPRTPARGGPSRCACLMPGHRKWARPGGRKRCIATISAT